MDFFDKPSHPLTTFIKVILITMTFGMASASECIMASVASYGDCNHAAVSAEDDDDAVEIVNSVLDRSEKVVNDTKDFIGWQITKICMWIAATVIVGGLIILAIKIASQPKSGRARSRSRRTRSTRRYS